MGRHGQVRARRPVPWELLGWGAFACVVAAGAVVWSGGTWPVAGLVVGAGVVGLGLLAALTALAPPTSSRRPGSSGPAPGASDDGPPPR